MSFNSPLAFNSLISPQFFPTQNATKIATPKHTDVRITKYHGFLLDLAVVYFSVNGIFSRERQESEESTEDL